MKKHLTHKETLYSLIYGVSGIAGIVGGWEHLDKPIIGPTIFCSGGLSLLYASSPLWFARLNRPVTNKKVLQSLQQFSPITKTIKWKEKPSREFIFNHDILQCPIPETMLMEFVDIGRKREMRARYNYQFGESKRIKIHQAWSSNYFTKFKRHKFIEEVYNSCIQILIVTGFFTIPRQGHPGRLIDPSIGTWQLVSDAKDWWQFLTQKESKERFEFNFSKLSLT